MNRYERFDVLIRETSKGRYPSLYDLCRVCERKERSIYNDLRYLREFMDVDIRFDQGKNGYYNASPEKPTLSFNLSLGEVIALTMAKEMLSEHSGGAFEPLLHTGLDKVSEGLPEKLRANLPNLVNVVRFKTYGIAPMSRKMFFDLGEACDDECLVQIQYASASDGQTTLREVEPLRLVENRNAWYLIAWCRLRDGIRMFALHRILEYKVLEENFEARDIDVDKYITEAFLLEHGDPLQRYTIKFDPVAARYVRERKWHPEQKLTEHGDGSCTLSFTATRMDEVRRWVLEFGASAHVLDPPELRALLHHEFTRGAAMYADAANLPIPIKAKDKKRVAAKTQTQNHSIGIEEK